MKTIIFILAIAAFVFLLLKNVFARDGTSKAEVNQNIDASQESKELNSLISSYQGDPEPYEWKDYNPTTLEEFKEAFYAEGLEDKWPYFKTQLKSEVRIKLKHVDEDLLEIGQSKIGGHPDLPTGTTWPMQKNGKRLAFLAQFNFEEIESDVPGIPKNGILYFFYDEAQEFWGDSKENSDSFRSIFVANPAKLERGTTPDDFVLLEEGMYKACKISFSNSFSLPNWEQEHVREHFKNTYNDAYLDISSSGQYITKLFGHSINVQNPMEYECEMVDRGYSWTIIPEEEKVIIEKESAKWKLLFQLDSESEAGMMWGDVGRLYFWMKEEDLMLHNFDRTWMVFQCH